LIWIKFPAANLRLGNGAGACHAKNQHMDRSQQLQSMTMPRSLMNRFCRGILFRSPGAFNSVLPLFAVMLYLDQNPLMD
jgi:hypothetical protein